MTEPRAAGSSTASERSNQAWLDALADEASGAYRDLRVIIVRGLRRILATRGVAEDLAEDFAHEALVRVRARKGEFRGDSRFTTWVLTIATRVAFDELRHKRWRDVSFEAITADAQGPLLVEPGRAAPDKTVARARVVAALGAAIEQHLTERQRAALVAELHGMPHAEIATALGVTRNALYKLTHDARRRVKASLAEAGVSEHEALWSFE